MLTLIVTVICVISAALISYGMQTPDLWKNGRNIKITKPSISDFDDLPNKYIICKYEEEIIQVYNDYLLWKRDIEKYTEYPSYIWLGAPLVFWFGIGKAIMVDFKDLSAFWVIAISIGITVLITILPWFIVTKCCHISFFDVAQVINEYHSNGASPEFPISIKRDLNNFLISRHYLFLALINNKERSRYQLRIIGYVLMLIVFLIALFL